MKKNILKIALLLVVGVVLYACSKDNESLPVEANIVQTVTADRTNFNDCSIATDNPYNYVGEIHNEIIQTFVNEYPEGIRDVSGLASEMDKISLNNSRFKAVAGNDFIPTNPQALIDGMRDFENNFHGIIDNVDASELTKDRLKELVDFMFREGNAAREPDYNNFDSELARFERGIMTSNKFNQEERKLLLSSVSVARNSSCFWHNYYNTGNKASSQTQDGVVMKRKWWQWAIIGVADVGGAIVGGSATAGAGTISSGAAASGLAYTMTNPKGK